MRVIDLLNKIANNEEIPKKIKYLGKEYEREPCYMLYEATGQCDELGFKSLLNREVEIIDEEKKIKKLKPELLKLRDEEEHWEYVDYLRTNVHFLAEKVNEIIDILNKGNKNE